MEGCFKMVDENNKQIGKKMYWLWGGIISFIIYTILIFLVFNTPGGDLGNIYVWIVLILSIPVFVFTYILDHLVPNLPELIYYFLIFPYSFGVGALIGWLLEK